MKAEFNQDGEWSIGNLWGFQAENIGGEPTFIINRRDNAISLTQETATALLPLLHHFARTGSLPGPGEVEAVTALRTLVCTRQHTPGTYSGPVDYPTIDAYMQACHPDAVELDSDATGVRHFRCRSVIPGKPDYIRVCWTEEDTAP